MAAARCTAPMTMALLLCLYGEVSGMPNGTGNTVMFAPYTLCAHAPPLPLSLHIVLV